MSKDDVVLFSLFTTGVVVGLGISMVASSFKPPIMEKNYCVESVNRPRAPGIQGDRPQIINLRSCSKEDLERESTIRHMDEKS